MDNWSAGFVDLDEGRIAFHRTGGDLPPLLLAHGLTDNGLCWTRVAQALESDFDVIMLDARGHGLSARIEADSRDDQGADITGVIMALGLEMPLVMGHSVGARAMANVANRFPAMVSRVVLEDPPFTTLAPKEVAHFRSEGFKKQVRKFAGMSLKEIEAYGRKVHPTWQAGEFHAWAQAKHQVDENVMGWFDFKPWQETIDKIEVSTLLVYGDSDKGGMINPDIVEEACRVNSQIRAAHIVGAGHNIHREKFDQYISIVREFLMGNS